MSKVIVAGVGMIPFEEPGNCDPYNDMGYQSARLALDETEVNRLKEIGVFGPGSLQ